MKSLPYAALLSILILASCNQAPSNQANQTPQEDQPTDAVFQQMVVDFQQKHPDLQPILDQAGVKYLSDLEPNVLYTLDAEGKLLVIRNPESEISKQFGGRAVVEPYNVIFGSDGTYVKAKIGNKVTCYNTVAGTDSSVDSTGVLTGPRGQRSQISATDLDFSGTTQATSSAYANHGVIDSGRGNYNHNGVHHAYCNGSPSTMYTEKNYFKN